MPDHPGFLADILARPDDDAPRLIYADWLTDHGEADWANFIRWQIARQPKLILPRAAYRTAHEMFSTWQVRCHFERDGLGICLELCDQLDIRAQPIGPVLQLVLRRGFVQSVRCTCALWLEHGQALVKREPIQLAQLVDRKPARPLTMKSRAVWWTNPKHSGLLDVPSDLPDELYTLLTDTSLIPAYPHPAAVHGGSQIYYPERRAAAFLGREYAMAALSAVCLGWARAAAG